MGKRNREDSDRRSEEHQTSEVGGSTSPAPAIEGKKPKTEGEAAKTAASAVVETNASGEQFLKLSDYRRVTVRSYQSKTLVDIRDFYKDKASGELKPGAKGISLTVEQWQMLKNNINAIDEMVDKLSSK